MPDSRYELYILQSLTNPKCTYVGITTNHKRRLRQHNGEIKGGAKQTQANRPWARVAYLTGFANDKQVRSLEKRMHMQKYKARGKGMSGLKGRLNTVENILGSAVWRKKNFVFLSMKTILTREEYCAHVTSLSPFFIGYTFAE